MVLSKEIKWHLLWLLSHVGNGGPISTTLCFDKFSFVGTIFNFFLILGLFCRKIKFEFGAHGTNETFKCFSCSEFSHQHKFLKG